MDNDGGELSTQDEQGIYDAEEVHEVDAYATVFLTVTLISCVMLAYYIKKNRIYYLPER